jgi:hypothetical protein
MTEYGLENVCKVLLTIGAVVGFVFMIVGSSQNWSWTPYEPIIIHKVNDAVSVVVGIYESGEVGIGFGVKIKKQF